MVFLAWKNPPTISSVHFASNSCVRSMDNMFSGANWIGRFSQRRNAMNRCHSGNPAQFMRAIVMVTEGDVGPSSCVKDPLRPVFMMTSLRTKSRTKRRSRSEKDHRSSDWIRGCLWYYFVDYLTNWLIDWLTNWLTDKLIKWPIDWLTNWLTGWLTDLLTDWLTDCHVR